MGETQEHRREAASRQQASGQQAATKTEHSTSSASPDSGHEKM